jgi:hypothetical protein
MGLAFALVLLGGCGDEGGGGGSGGQEIVVLLEGVGESGTTGEVSISPSGDQTNVFVVAIIPSGGGEQPANVHTGTCAQFDETPAYEIGNLQEGTGAATLDIPVDTLLDSPHAVVIRKSPDEATVTIACGDIAAP